MTRRAPFRQVDVTRLVKGAIKGGLPEGSFEITIVDGQLRLTPAAAPSMTEAQRVQKLMEGAFGR